MHGKPNEGPEDQLGRLSDSASSREAPCTLASRALLVGPVGARALMSHPPALPCDIACTRTLLGRTFPARSRESFVSLSGTRCMVL